MKHCYCFCFSFMVNCTAFWLALTWLWLIGKVFSSHIIKIICLMSTHLWYLFLFSVLGTFAATYLTVAITVKYHWRPVHEINLSPLYSSGWVESDHAFNLVASCIKDLYLLIIIFSSCSAWTNLTVILSSERK